MDSTVAEERSNCLFLNTHPKFSSSDFLHSVPATVYLFPVPPPPHLHPVRRAMEIWTSHGLLLWVRAPGTPDGTGRDYYYDRSSGRGQKTVVSNLYSCLSISTPTRFAQSSWPVGGCGSAVGVGCRTQSELLYLSVLFQVHLRPLTG